MPEPIFVAPGVVIPASAQEFRASRSSGPGGQNVNKVASKAELRVDLARIEGLDGGARRRLLRLVEGRTDARGRLLLTSQRTRDQRRNLEDAREKVRALVARALVVPVRRRPTSATAGARERRLAAKRKSGTVKRTRGRVRSEEE